MHAAVSVVVSVVVSFAMSLAVSAASIYEIFGSRNKTIFLIQN